MADRGIDAIADGSAIFQVKWNSKLLQDPVAWLAEALGTRGRLRLAGLLVGSVSQVCAAAAQCPVVLVMQLLSAEG